MQKTFYYSGIRHKIADFVRVASAMILPAFSMLIFIL